MASYNRTHERLQTLGGSSTLSQSPHFLFVESLPIRIGNTNSFIYKKHKWHDMKTKHINKIKNKKWLNTSKCGKYSVHFSKFCSVFLSLYIQATASRWEHNCLSSVTHKPHGGHTSLTDITVLALHPSLVVFNVGDRGFLHSFTQDPELSPDTQFNPLLPERSPLDIQSEWGSWPSLSLCGCSPLLKAYNCCVKVTSTPLSVTLHSTSQHMTYFLPCGRLLIISPTRD